jgi:hypothetical protein
MVVTLFVQNQHISGIVAVAVAVAVVVVVVDNLQYNIGKFLIVRTHDETRMVMLEFPIIIIIIIIITITITTTITTTIGSDWNELSHQSNFALLCAPGETTTTMMIGVIIIVS